VGAPPKSWFFDGSHWPFQFGVIFASTNAPAAKAGGEPAASLILPPSTIATDKFPIKAEVSSPLIAIRLLVMREAKNGPYESVPARGYERCRLKR